MKPNLMRAIGGGVAGTAVFTAMIYFIAPTMLGHPMDIAAMLSTILGNSWTLGMIAHWMTGVIIFPLIYAFVAYSLLPGPPVARGILWGLILWLAAEAVMMPILGVGFFHAAAGGIKAAIAGLIGHILYGASLGAVAGGPETGFRGSSHA
jgi:uncharacterized membrane protein YagU involved in acid resistance